MVESSDQISERAIELAGDGDRESAVNELVRLVGGDVAGLERLATPWWGAFGGAATTTPPPRV